MIPSLGLNLSLACLYLVLSLKPREKNLAEILVALQKEILNVLRRKIFNNLLPKQQFVTQKETPNVLHEKWSH